jgi:transketolase
MRKKFVEELIPLMKKETSIEFLTADLGFRALENVRDNFPDRFHNIGIAEANMMGIAAGMALEGKHVITYSIAPFATMRCYEQIRNDICYHNLSVLIVGTGGGLNYTHHGVTHHSIEDLAIMSALPNMTVINPARSSEITGLVAAWMDRGGPAYVRLGRDIQIVSETQKPKLNIGKGYCVKKGKDVALFVTGNLLDRVLKIADRLENESTHSVGVWSFPTIKPIDSSLIRKVASSAKGIFTFEEHNIYIGFGSLVARVLAEADIPKKQFLAFGIPDRFVKEVGELDYLRDRAGMNTTTIKNKILNLL